MSVNLTLDDELDAAYTGTESATGLRDRLVALVKAAFGDANPFGTAATEDVGDKEGDMPQVGGTGRLPRDLVQERVPADTLTRGTLPLDGIPQGLDAGDVTGRVRASVVRDLAAGDAIGGRIDPANLPPEVANAPDLLGSAPIETPEHLSITGVERERQAWAAGGRGTFFTTGRYTINAQGEIVGIMRYFG